MRPILVLLLVLAAVGALLFAFLSGGDGGKRRAGVLEGPTPVTRNEPRTGEPANLTSIENDREAVPEPVRAPVQPVVEPDATGLVFENGLTGQVINEEGKPVAGARVVLGFQSSQILFMDQSADRSRERESITSEQGKYLFEKIEPSEYYTLIVTHPEYSRDEISNVRVPLDQVVEGPPIVLRKGASLTGWVRDTEGNPVPEAELVLDVNVFGDVSEHAQKAKIDAQGHYDIPNVAAGMRALRVEAAGYGTQFHGGIAFNGRDSRQLDITLAPAAMIGGRVRAADGSGIKGVEVTAINYTNSNRSTRDVATTDAKGEFVLDSLNQGDYTLLFVKPGYKRDRLNRVTTGDMNVDFELSRRAVVRGTVVDASTGAKVPGGDLLLRRTIEGTDMTEITDVRGTFKNGEFELADIQGGEYVLEASAEKHGLAATFSNPFVVIEGQDFDGLTISLTKGATIKGRVVNQAGQPIPGALVSTHENDFTTSEFRDTFGDMFPTNVKSQKTRAAADGSFELTAIRPDQLQVTIEHDGFTTWRQRNLKLAESQVYDLGTVRMSQGGKVTGVLRNRAGETVPGAQVRMQPQISQGGAQIIRRPYTTVTDSKGNFTFTNVQPGQYDLFTAGSASANDNPFIGIKSQELSKVKVRVEEGGSTSYDLTAYE